MAINTVGGSDVGTFTNAGVVAGVPSIETDTIFTTSATADYMYFIAVDLLSTYSETKILVDRGDGLATVLVSQGRAKFVVGPNTAVRVMSIGVNNGTQTVNWSYSYLGIKVA